LSLRRAALAAAPPPNLTEPMTDLAAGAQAAGRVTGTHAPQVEWVHVARVSALERQLAAARDDLSQAVAASS
jgi:hypothetical protein